MNTFWGREGEGDKIYVYNLRTGAIQFFFVYLEYYLLPPKMHERVSK